MRSGAIKLLHSKQTSNLFRLVIKKSWNGTLHISSILPTDTIQRMADLPFAVVLHRFHQLRKHILAITRSLL